MQLYPTAVVQPCPNTKIWPKINDDFIESVIVQIPRYHRSCHAHAVELDRREIGQPTDLESSTVLPAERGVSGVRRGGEQFDRRVIPTLECVETTVELDGAGFLEQVDHRVGIATETEPSSGVGQWPCGTDAVGQVALGGGAETASGLRRSEQSDVLVGEMGGVDRGEVGIEQTGLAAAAAAFQRQSRRRSERLGESTPT